MSSDSVITFDDLQVPEVSPCTRLHPLPPIGIATPHVESLTGYISRLAFSYCVTPGTLVTREISYVVQNGTPKIGDDPSYIAEKTTGEAINGVAPCAKD